MQGHRACPGFTQLWVGTFKETFVKRKILVAATTVIGLSLITPVTKADTYLGQVVLVNNTSEYSSNVGGEFNATLYYASSVTFRPVVPQATPPFIASQDSTPPSPSSGLDLTNPAVFQTFCIQEGSNDVTFSPGTYYAATINPSTVNNSDVSMTVSTIAADLFNAFYNGTLTNYDYTLGSGRSLSAGELQAAIWVAQGDQPNTTAGWAAAASDAGISDTTQAQAWYNDASSFSVLPGTAIEILGMYDTEAEAEAGGADGIHQSQLVEVFQSSDAPTVPVPTAAHGIMALLGGIGLFRLTRRARFEF
jgi:hypothetical protein